MSRNGIFLCRNGRHDGHKRWVTTAPPFSSSPNTIAVDFTQMLWKREQFGLPEAHSRQCPGALDLHDNRILFTLLGFYSGVFFWDTQSHKYLQKLFLKKKHGTQILIFEFGLDWFYCGANLVHVGHATRHLILNIDRGMGSHFSLRGSTRVLITYISMMDWAMRQKVYLHQQKKSKISFCIT